MAVARQPFSVSVDPDGVFVPTGELDFSTIQELEGLVREVIVPGRAIVLDLAQLAFMDSCVIHWLVEICDLSGHPVVLRNASPAVRRILDIAAILGPDGEAWLVEAD